MVFDHQAHLLPGLPPYIGGRMADACYDAGSGLYAVFNDGKPFAYPADGPWFKGILAQMPYMEHCGFTLSAPVNAEEFSLTCSNGRSSYTATLQDGLFALIQTQRAFAKLDDPALLRAVTDTDKTAFAAYLDRLAAEGWRTVWQNQMEENFFLALTKEDRRIYASFYGREGIARFVQDDLGTPIEDFGGGEAIPGETVQVCQFGLYYSHMIPGRCSDCGMLYIVKLPDNSLFLVDGGMLEQATEAATAEVMRVMRHMSKVAEVEKIRIAGWFCTHAHDDHSDLFCKLLRKYHDQLDVERIIFNFPASGVWGTLPINADILRERLHLYCPGAKYLKCHTGQSWELAGVRFEVLQTHEDGVTITGQETISFPSGGTDFNDSSTVLKITFDGASFLILGDINNASESLLLRHFSVNTLHATMMQAAHHMINNLPELYPVIAPEIALVPRAVFVATDTNTHYTTLLKTIPAQNVYFASCATDVFEARNGHFKLVERFPIEGYLYDGSQI